MAEVHRRHKIIPLGLVGGGGGAVWRHDHDKRLAPRRKLIGAQSGTGLTGFACACPARQFHEAAAAQVGMPLKPRKVGCAAADAPGCVAVRGSDPGGAPLAGSLLAVHAKPGERLAYRHHFQHIDIDMGGQGGDPEHGPGDIVRHQRIGIFVGVFHLVLIAFEPHR